MDLDMDVDAMLFLAAVIEDSMDVLRMVEDPMMGALMGGVADIAREHLNEAQVALDRLIAEDPSWRAV